jgi:DNA-binding transcriptional ArsR family regulator
MIPVFQNHAAASLHQDAIRELMMKAAERDNQQPKRAFEFANHKTRSEESTVSQIMRRLKPGRQYTFAQVCSAIGTQGCKVQSALKDLRSKGIVTASKIDGKNMAYTLVGPDH